MHIMSSGRDNDDESIKIVTKEAITSALVLRSQLTCIPCHAMLIRVKLSLISPLTLDYSGQFVLCFASGNLN